MNCYLMERRGSFHPKHLTKNQCKAEGQFNYNYAVKMLFAQGIKLDKNKFIIDHQHIDDAVQKCILTGSCEEMHIEIAEAIQNLMRKRKIPMVAMKCVIIPINPSGLAELTHFWAKDIKHLNIVI